MCIIEHADLHACDEDAGCKGGESFGCVVGWKNLEFGMGENAKWIAC